MSNTKKIIFYIVATLYIIMITLTFVLSKAGYDHYVVQAGLHWVVILSFPWIVPLLILFVRVKKGKDPDLLYYVVIVVVSFLLLLFFVPLLECLCGIFHSVYN